MHIASTKNGHSGLVCPNFQIPALTDPKPRKPKPLIMKTRYVVPRGWSCECRGVFGAPLAKDAAVADLLRLRTWKAGQAYDKYRVRI